MSSVQLHTVIVFLIVATSSTSVIWLSKNKALLCLQRIYDLCYAFTCNLQGNILFSRRFFEMLCPSVYPLVHPCPPVRDWYCTPGIRDIHSLRVTHYLSGIHGIYPQTRDGCVQSETITVNFKNGPDTEMVNFSVWEQLSLLFKCLLNCKLMDKKTCGEIKKTKSSSSEICDS